jgi:hypothetical protein
MRKRNRMMVPTHLGSDLETRKKMRRRRKKR